ncbi:MAG: hypothetical protein IT453_11665 [Planctomycetes bacterium]|nr:hypothetical protein [Planctomycetota bacterium]
MSLSHHARALLFAAASLAAFSTLTPNAKAQTIKLDDGTPGAALSYAFPEDYCWFNVLNAGGTKTITSVEAIIGDVPNGWPIHICIWRDLGQMGDPGQGLLLTQVDTVVQNSGKQLLTQYAVPPTTVTGLFFVGVYLTTDGTFSMSTMDPHTNLPGRSWFGWAYGPGTFDPSFTGAWSWWAPQTVGFKGVWMLRANAIDGPTPDIRCVSKTNSLGCVPLMTLSGTPSASAPSGFVVATANVLNKKSGLFLYSLTGLQQVPFAGGHLCIRPPFKRTSMINSGGSASGNDCTGNLSFDFNTYVASGADPALVAGTTVDGHFWSRDSGFAAPNNVGLSQAVHFGLTP